MVKPNEQSEITKRFPCGCVVDASHDLYRCQAHWNEDSVPDEWADCAWDAEAGEEGE